MPIGSPEMMGVSAGLQAIAGVAQIAQSEKQNKEAKDLQSQLVDPRYEVQQPILDNQALAESMASQGLSATATSAYNNTNDRSLSYGVDSLLRGGGNINSISDLYSRSTDSAEKLAMLNEEVLMRNRRQLFDKNEKLANELEKQWMVNEYGPAQDTKQLIATLRSQANQNKWGGINTIISGVNNYATGNLMAGEGRIPGVSDSVTANHYSAPVNTISAARPNNTLPNTIYMPDGTPYENYYTSALLNKFRNRPQ